MSPPDPLPSDEAIEASLEAAPTTMLGCTCRWDEHGNPPADCRCAERSCAYAMERRKDALTAAYRIDMPRREAEVRAATLREVSAWLEEADPYVARDFAVYLNQEAE